MENSFPTPNPPYLPNTASYTSVLRTISKLQTVTSEGEHERKEDLFIACIIILDRMKNLGGTTSQQYVRDMSVIYLYGVTLLSIRSPSCRRGISGRILLVVNCMYTIQVWRAIPTLIVSFSLERYLLCYLVHWFCMPILEWRLYVCAVYNSSHLKLVSGWVDHPVSQQLKCCFDRYYDCIYLYILTYRI